MVMVLLGLDDLIHVLPVLLLYHGLTEGTVDHGPGGGSTRLRCLRIMMNILSPHSGAVGSN